MTALRTTPLHPEHLAAGAKMVDFGGFHMPLQYVGILAEHKAVRTAAGLFDVSHMGEIDFHGANALATVQRLVTNDVGNLPVGKAAYTCTCRVDGGIVDDCIVYRVAEDLVRIVVNASNIAKDEAHFREHAGAESEIVNRSEETALIAVQGPNAVALVATLAGDPALAAIPSFGLGHATLAGANVMLARTGYTGEDGFEVFTAAGDAVAVWRALVAAGGQPIGLGARDTLRLEAKLCLYGNDIDETTNPLEAGLGWVVKPAKGEFVGRDALLAAKEKGLSRTLVGFRGLDRGIPRHGWDVLASETEATVVGHVTSAGPAPTVGGTVGMAYVPLAMSTAGAILTLGSGDKRVRAEVVKGPFYRRPA